MSEYHVEITFAMEEVASRLKKKFPEMEFFFLMIPFHRSTLQHLSTEQRYELEKRVVRAASRAFDEYIKAPDPLKGEA